MKNYYFAVFLSFICSNCVFAQQKILPKNENEIQAAVEKGIDPYFVESTDTVSMYGPFSIVRNILQDKNGDYWLASWQGIIKYDGKTFTNYTLKNGLIHFHVFSCFEDSKGDLWFGTVRGGLYKYDGKTFTLFTKKDGLGGNSAETISEDKQGNIWFATEGGATMYDGKTFKNFTGKDGLCGDDVNAIICDKTGKLWIGCKNGISIYSGGSFTDFKHSDGSAFVQTASLFEDKDGNIWIGSNKGFYVYNGKTFSDPLRDHFVMYMCQEKNGKLWTAINQQNSTGAFEGFALCRYDPSKIFSGTGKVYTKVKTKYDPNNSLIFGMIIDRNGKMWFGSLKGICCFDPSRAENTCVQGTCSHKGNYSEMAKVHEAELAKSFTYFNK